LFFYSFSPSKRDARSWNVGPIEPPRVISRYRTGGRLGFDILSFDEADDSERMLEVKTTGLGKFFPFYVTSNEVRCSEDVPQQFQLFRVFDFGREPRLYILHGSLRELCQLDPVLYRAVI